MNLNFVYVFKSRNNMGTYYWHLSGIVYNFNTLSKSLSNLGCQSCSQTAIPLHICMVYTPHVYYTLFKPVKRCQAAIDLASILMVILKPYAYQAPILTP
jgi:hypothetical protein